MADLMGGQMRGMVVLLDDSGHLTVSYLGTDPMLNPVGFGEVGAGTTTPDAFLSCLLCVVVLCGKVW